MNGKNKKSWFIVCSGFLVLFLCVTILVSRRNKTILLNYDSANIEFITTSNLITCITIRGQFPYQSILPKLADKRETDATGTITEIYTIEAEFSLNQQNSLKINIETSDEVIYIYILKFADKDITIVNGKVVE